MAEAPANSQRYRAAYKKVGMRKIVTNIVTPSLTEWEKSESSHFFEMAGLKCKITHHTVGFRCRQ
jgi:hypothetical protein